MNRQQLLAELARPAVRDLVVIGGGATGLGVALDAAARGYSVVLIEARDFAKGTSSRATKLVHGGVRYLAQGNLALVREALRERAILLRNASHLAQPIPFIMPTYRSWEKPFYGLGLKLYDAMAGHSGLGHTEFLSAKQTLACLPNARPEGLRGGMKYWDGQFDDARLALALARTASLRGALVVNYCEAEALIHERGRVAGVRCRDQETGAVFELKAGCVINATGVWVDALRRQEAQASGREAQPLVAPSQGVHLVVDRSFLPGQHAMIIPRTSDGRVLFAVPWLGKVVLGTTDTPRQDLPEEPRPYPAEVEFILREAGRYLAKAPAPGDVRSAWVGLRPLVRPPGQDRVRTQSFSREHVIAVSPGGLVSVTGGKWTTYRAMAEDVLERCFRGRLLKRTPAGVTADLKLLGTGIEGGAGVSLTGPQGLHSYGGEAATVSEFPGAGRELAPGLTEAMVRFAARHEFARTAEDILARRCRLLFLDARLAGRLAVDVGALLREETGADPQVAHFQRLADEYARF